MSKHIPGLLNPASRLKLLRLTPNSTDSLQGLTPPEVAGSLPTSGLVRGLGGSGSAGTCKLLSYSHRAKGVLKGHILPLPDVQHSIVKQLATSAPRRSRRLAASASNKASADQRMHFILAEKLGLIQGKGFEEHSSQNALTSLFDTQLSREHIVALASITFLPSGIQGNAEAMVAVAPVSAD